jgi:hypothetical protein
VVAKVSARDWQVFEALALAGRPAAAVAAEHGMTVAAAYRARMRVQQKLSDEAQEMEGEGAAGG